MLIAMSDNPGPEPTSPTEASNTTNVTNVSGGVNLDAEPIDIGGDVIGRDKTTTNINTDGGAVVGGDVNVGSGKFVGRDEITITEEVAYNVEGLENPYLGLMPFTYDERDIYAGRDDEIDDAVARLTTPGAQQVLLFVTGGSGSGKSSLVQAGLLIPQGAGASCFLFAPHAIRSYNTTHVTLEEH